MLKLILLELVRIIFSFLKLFPIKQNQYFFLSYKGRQFSCNPRAIYLYLEANTTNNIFVWGINNSELVSKCYNNKLIWVKPKSLQYYLKLIQSKYVITNIQLPSFLPKKKDAIWVNTWHGGGAFKLVEYPSVGIYSKMTRNIQCKNTTYYISSSKKFTEIMSNSTSIPKEKFLNIGMPRNDIFFYNQLQKNEIREKICKYYDILSENIIVLYAPTYRGNVTTAYFDMELDLNLIKSAIEKKFKKTVCFIIRSHHSVQKYSKKLLSGVKDGSIYDEMQELLVASDILITDYSSCIYDFALSYKPAFLFVPDLKEYEEQRGLYTSISEWPFEYAENNAILAELIMNYDTKIAEEKINKYLYSLGAYDIGKSTSRLIQILENKNGR